MDRFIVITNIPKAKIGLVLKSNMDRFIGLHPFRLQES